MAASIPQSRRDGALRSKPGQLAYVGKASRLTRPEGPILWRVPSPLRSRLRVLGVFVVQHFLRALSPS